MKEKNESSTPAPLSRRAVLRRAVAAGLVASGFPAVAEEVERAAKADPGFVPENDYPYFGYQPGAE